MRSKFLRTSFFVLLATLTLHSCGDDASSNSNMIKGLVTVAGAGGGAYAGSQLAGPGNKTLGTVTGAVAGGGLGYLLGGAVGGTSK